MPTNDAKIEIVKVLMFNVAGIGVTFTNIENSLKIVALVLTISYTAYKWYKDLKNK